MTVKQLLSAFDDPGDKEKVLSLLPVVRDPAGIRDSDNWTLLHWAGWTDVCRTRWTHTVGIVLGTQLYTGPVYSTTLM